MNQSHVNGSLERLECFEEIMKSSGYILDCSGLLEKKQETKLCPPKLASDLQLPGSTILDVSSTVSFSLLVWLRTRMCLSGELDCLL